MKNLRSIPKSAGKRAKNRPTKKCLTLARWLTVIFLLHVFPPYQAVKVIEDFKCSPSTSSTSIAIGSVLTSSPQKFSLGFWIKIPTGQTYGYSTAFRIVGGGSESRFTFSNAGSMNLNFNHDGTSGALFTLKESTGLDDANYQYMRKGVPGNNWNYIAFFFNTVDSTYAVSTINMVPNYIPYGAFFNENSLTFFIGNSIVTSFCFCSFHIHKLHIYEEAYDSWIPYYFNVSRMIADVDGSFKALYKLNRFPLAEWLVNILDPSLYKATIATKAINRLSFNFPQISGLNRFIFDGAEMKITWPAIVQKISIIDNSYFINFDLKLQGLPQLAKLKLTGGAMPTTPFHIVYYQRSPASNLSTKIFSGEQFFRFDSWECEVQIFINNSLASSTLTEFLEPTQQTVFDLHSMSGIRAYFSNNLLEPSVFGLDGYSWDSPFSALAANPQLAEDDIHSTFVVGQADKFLIRILLSEISIFEGALGFEIPKARIASGAYQAIELHPSYLDPADLLRFDPTSSSTLILNSSTEVTSNCNNLHCEYCEAGVCVLCNVSYYLVAGVCTLCASNFVFDLVTRQCITSGVVSTTSVAGLAQIINTMSQTNVVSMNISFEVRHPFDSAPTSIDRYVIYFNSVQSLSYEPLTRAFCSPTEIQSQLDKLNTLFADHQTLLAGFGPYQNYKITYAPFGTTVFKIPNPQLFPTGSNCYSPSLAYNPINPYERKCGTGCVLGRFLLGSTICDTCSPNCMKCTSFSQCTQCYSGYTLESNFCWPIPPPGMLLPTNEPPGPYNNFGPNGSSAPSNPFQYIEYPRPSLHTENFSGIIDELDELVRGPAKILKCRTGYFIENFECRKCSRGCLECPNSYECTVCDSNSQLNDKKLCILKPKSLLTEPSAPGDDTSGCKACFQMQDIQSPSCARCASVCPCGITNVYQDSSFLLRCQNALLDKRNLAVLGSNDQYYLREGEGDFAMFIFLKLKVRSAKFTINLSLVKNTTDCVIKPGTSFELNASPQGIVLPPNLTFARIKMSIGIAADAAMTVMMLVSFPFANSFLDLIQFNKQFLYLSTLNVMVGGLFDYINFNLHDNPNPERPWFIHSDKNYSFSYLNWLYYANKIASWVNLITYFSLIGACLILPLVWKTLTKKSKKVKIKALSEKIDEKSNKMYFGVCKKNLDKLLASVSWGFSLLPDAQAVAYRGMIISVMVLVLYFPIKNYWKALKYIKSNGSSKTAYFNSLRAPREEAKNKMLMKGRIIEESFFFIRSLFLYHLRHYPVPALVFSLFLVLIQIAVTARFVEKLNFALKTIVVAELSIFFVFICLVFIKCFGFNIPVLAFDIVYLLSNLAKLTNIVMEFLVIFKKNKINQKRTVPRNRIPGNREPETELKTLDVQKVDSSNLALEKTELGRKQQKGPLLAVA